MAAEAPTEDTVAVFDPMGSRRRSRGNATVEWGCSQEAARDGGTPVVKPPRNQHRVRAGARGWSSFSQENSYGGKRQRVERKKGGKKRVDTLGASKPMPTPKHRGGFLVSVQNGRRQASAYIYSSNVAQRIPRRGGEGWDDRGEIFSSEKRGCSARRKPRRSTTLGNTERNTREGSGVGWDCEASVCLCRRQ